MTHSNAHRACRGPGRWIPRAIAPLLGLLLLAGCKPEGEGRTPREDRPATTPTMAVQRLLDDLRRDDLAAYAAHALPPDLYARTEAAWRQGHSRWPLSELPLGIRIPAAVDHLAAPGAATALQQTYRHQFAGQHRELRSTAATLALFAGRYVEHDAGYPADERDHRLQLARALGAWGQRAPLGDRARVEPLIAPLAAAARASRLAGGDPAFSAAGMHRSLTALQPVLRQTRVGLKALGLDLDQTLREARIETVETSADRARLRLHYRLAGHDVTAMLDLERRPEGWFLVDSLRHAQAQLRPLGPPAPPAVAAAPVVAPAP